MRSISCSGTIVATLTLIAGAAYAHDDIEVELNGSQLATEAQVYESMFGETGIPYFTDDPGFEGESGVFSPGSSIGFNIISPLGFWNGGGFDDLDPSTAESLTVGFGPNAVTTNTGFVGGFDFVADASTGFDTHLDFTLNGVGGNAPSDGVFLLSLELTSNTYATSDSIWIVFGNNVDEAVLDGAVEWVEVNLVPAPGPLALLGGAMLLTGRRRRRS